jgi:hypothetical protein
MRLHSDVPCLNTLEEVTQRYAHLSSDLRSQSVDTSKLITRGDIKVFLPPIGQSQNLAGRLFTNNFKVALLSTASGILRRCRMSLFDCL